MGNFARGKYAKTISDRSGMAFPYREMLKEWNGALVHKSEYESKQPQLEPRVHAADPQGLLDSRPDRVESIVPVLLSLNAFTCSGGETFIKIFEPEHGRSTGDTVRFRNVTGAVSIVILNSANDTSGRTITVIDNDFYSYSVSPAPNQRLGTTLIFGGGDASAGPVTILP
tara:strand:+ start:45 stop:554 length:510 start_codon:yes stop_codon:yes gene_type:complete